MNSKTLLAIGGTFVGCCMNVYFFELILKMDPGAGTLVTFAQFAFIAAEGFLFTWKCGREYLRISLRHYVFLICMYFIASVCNNYAFDFNIPMPLHMIFRSGSLLTNMIMGIIILRKRYALSKYVAVVMITIGIIICMFESSHTVNKIAAHTTADELSEEEPTTGASDAALFQWTIGIGLLTFALFVSARMGIYQERLYARFGKHPREALFVIHALSLPGFLLLAPNIWEHAKIATTTQPYEFYWFAIPIAWVYLVANCFTQHLCNSSVFILTTECPSLTVTLVLTLRKFVSLIFSIFYFQNPFTINHWIGTALVFGGTLIFTEVFGKKKKD